MSRSHSNPASGPWTSSNSLRINLIMECLSCNLFFGVFALWTIDSETTCLSFSIYPIVLHASGLLLTDRLNIPRVNVIGSTLIFWLESMVLPSINKMMGSKISLPVCNRNILQVSLYHHPEFKSERTDPSGTESKGSFGLSKRFSSFIKPVLDRSDATAARKEKYTTGILAPCGR